MNTKRIAVTMGDASGIGPELALKAWQEGHLPSDIFVIGDLAALTLCNQTLSLNVPLHTVTDTLDLVTDRLNVFDLGCLEMTQIRPGQLNRQSGVAAAQYVVKAVDLYHAGKIDAVVTLPMNKEATRLSLPDFTGHTELLASLCGCTDYTMMLTSEKLTVTHVSTHVSITEAVKAVTTQRVVDVIRLTDQALRRLMPAPKIAVAGLNPHAGENGAFGDEELQSIIPAVNRARQEGIQCTGPIAPDTVFLKAVQGEYDAVVCMYHDQGHIPMKLLDFDGGVNVTLGLDLIRTSVDHGTAFDIAYQGIASTKSFVRALETARAMMGEG
ncbi:MAG: 4-hydroxythreonine-4-phosphate dehydrogenase PdxA [Eubacteriales bacterium]|nr:4-hydroxythreonine-4-phosphate dehydrogenase PdxA [Eubacteriales bacterium]